MLPFLSTFIHKIDRKGRLSLPAPFRATLKQGVTPEIVVVLPSYKQQALEGMTTERITKISQAVDNLDLYSQEQSDMAAALFADATMMNIDGDGRIVLREDFMAYANLNGEAALVGRGETFEIWNPGTFKEYQEIARSRMREQKLSLRLNQFNKGSDT